VRVLADGQTHRHADANRFYNLSHAICYSYGADKNRKTGQKGALPSSPHNVCGTGEGTSEGQ